jgi:hypothetical protein
MTQLAALVPLAHIAGIPVQEWSPFIVPLVALYFFGRHRERRRRGEVAQIPERSEALDPAVVEQIVAGWKEARYEEVTPAHLPLLYPPGPDGLSVAELVRRTTCDEPTVQALLEQLERAEYLDLFPAAEPGEMQASLTLRGYGLVDQTEDSLLAALRKADSATAAA